MDVYVCWYFNDHVNENRIESIWHSEDKARRRNEDNIKHGLKNCHITDEFLSDYYDN